MKLWQRRVIGILMLGGGAVGIVVTLQFLPTRTQFIEWIILLIFLALYSWGLWCGVRLLENQPGSVRSSIRFWLTQVPSFSSPILGYFLSCGFHTTVSLQFAPLKFDANFVIGSIFTYSLLEAQKPWAIGINVFALAIAWWLSRVNRQSGLPTSPAPSVVETTTPQD